MKSEQRRDRGRGGRAVADLLHTIESFLENAAIDSVVVFLDGRAHTLAPRASRTPPVTSALYESQAQPSQ